MLPRATRRFLVGLALAAATGCDDDRPKPAPPAPASSAAAAIGKLELVPGPAQGDLAEVVRVERDRAKAEGRELIVYVGASWCEPCGRFHEAAAAGKLDREFPKLRLLEFDFDRDEARLVAAGYQSKMIPLFAIPGPDGRGTGKQIEGSVKGDLAVQNIAPRLRQLLDDG